MNDLPSPSASDPHYKSNSPHKTGINKFFKSFRLFGFVKRNPTPKQHKKSHLKNPAHNDGVSIVNPNARFEFDDTRLENSNEAPSGSTFDGSFSYFFSICSGQSHDVSLFFKESTRGSLPLRIPIVTFGENTDALSTPIRPTGAYKMTSK